MISTRGKVDAPLTSSHSHLMFHSPVPMSSQSASETTTEPAQHLAALLELVARLRTSESPTDAAAVLAIDVAEYLKAHHVVVGLCDRPASICEVAAVSDLDTFSPRSEPIRLAQAALQETLARNEICVWPPRASDARHGLLALRQYANLHPNSTLVAAPLRDGLGVVRGAWLICHPDRSALENIQRFISAAEQPVGASLQLLKQSRRSLFARCRDELSAAARSWKGTLALTGTLLLAAIGSIPMPLSVRCDCTLEPVLKRHVAAPFAGPLERAFVEPGDVVQAGQLLAQMDGREIRWELAGLRAELQRAAKERAGHMAQHDSGKQEVSRHEVERLKVRTALLEHRDSNLQIRSPIDGMVVMGDLKKSEGRPLEVGQPLFEIAPLDAMTVELAIDEEDVRYVRTGMPVSLRLEGSPFTTREATILRVHPRAEIRDQKNVFIAEARLDNPLDELRPGMRGDARITSDRSPLGWQLVRKPLAAALSWLGW